MGARGFVCLGLGLALGLGAGSAQAVSGPFSWKGYTWKPTTGGMAGVVPGDAANVTIDSSGYLHLKIAKSGSTWSASEVFTTTSLGFGTYQWQIAGPIDRMDHTVVLGLFPYGPAAGIGADGTNEIDTEFSFWNDELPNVNADFGVYPATAQGMHWEDDYLFSLNGGNATTARMTWTKTGVTSTLLSGFQPLGSNNGFIKSDTYAPADVSNNIPQQAMPLGMNLWCYKGVPSSGQDVEVVLQDFQFVPEGQPIPGDDAGPESGSPSDASDGDSITGDAVTGDDSAADATSGDDSSNGDDAAPAVDAGPDPGAGADAGVATADAGPILDSGGAGHLPDAGTLPATTGMAGALSADAGCSCRATGHRPEGEGSIALLGAMAFLLRRRRWGSAYGGCPHTSAPSR
jgi:MYXO-CTERM domain-containing protein